MHRCHLFPVSLAFSLLAALLPLAATASPGAWPLPLSEIRTLADAVDARAYAGADRVVVHSLTDVVVKESGEALRTEQVAVKALTPAGARQLKVLRFDYDPASSDISVVSVHILAADGRTDSVDLARVLDRPAPKYWIYWTMRVKLLELPEVRPGDTVLWQTEFRGFQIAYLEDEAAAEDRAHGAPAGGAPETAEDRFVPPQRGEFYDVVLFGSDVPIVRQVYRIALPLDKPVQYLVANGPLGSGQETTADVHRYTFWRDNAPLWPLETGAAAMSDSVPKLVLATLPGWPEKSRWFFLVNEPSFVSTPEIDRKVVQIIMGKRTDAEKMTALNRWVAHNIRYSGLSMGKGEGYTLHPGGMTFRDRCGVCKDKAGMLVTMMRAAGYSETYAAMTMAGARVEDVPADQFNHAVVVWREPGGSWRLLDPTWAPLSRQDWSRAEAEQHYVIGSPAGEQLAITPALSPADNVLQFSVRTEIDAHGNARSRCKVSAAGYVEDTMRRWFAGAPRDRWEKNLAAIARKAYPWAKVTSFSVDPAAVMDLDSPFAFSFDFATAAALPAAKTTAGSFRPFAFALPMPEPRTSENLLPDNVSGRMRGLFFRCAKTLRFQEEIVFPAAVTLKDWKDLSVENRHGSVKAAVAVKGRSVFVDVQAAFATRFVPGHGLAEYQQLLDALAAVRSARLILDGGPK